MSGGVDALLGLVGVVKILQDGQRQQAADLLVGRDRLAVERGDRRVVDLALEPQQPRRADLRGVEADGQGLAGRPVVGEAVAARIIARVEVARG